jgi:hypothetical protein
VGENDDDLVNEAVVDELNGNDLEEENERVAFAE